MKITPADLDKRDSHHLITSAILPRPVVLISTIGEDGVHNVAPFSAFNFFGVKPAMVGLHIGLWRDGRKKDTLRNIEYSGDFVVNTVDEDMAEAMNQASADYPSDVDEFKEVGFTAVKGDLVKAPMVAESAVNMECRVKQIMEFGEVPTGGHVIIGEVVLVHVKDELWAGNHVDKSKFKAIGRLGE